MARRQESRAAEGQGGIGGGMPQEIEATKAPVVDIEMELLNLRARVRTLESKNAALEELVLKTIFAIRDAFSGEKP